MHPPLGVVCWIIALAMAVLIASLRRRHSFPITSPITTCAEQLLAGMTGRCPSAASKFDDVIRQLELHGFARMQGFLDDNALREARLIPDDKPGAGFGGYGSTTVKAFDEQALFSHAPHVALRLQELIQHIGGTSTFDIDTLDPVHNLVFAFNTTELSEQQLQDNQFHFGSWHQDSEPHFVWELDPYRYTHLIIPLWKDHPQGLNIELLPFDVLSECARDHARLFRNKTAGKFYHRAEAGGLIQQLFARLPSDVGTLRLDERDNSVIGIDFDVADLACVPKLQEGDILIFRGDTVHRTEPFTFDSDHAHHRISLHVAAFAARTKVRIKDILQGSLRKYRIMTQTINHYADSLALISMYGSTETTQGELRKRMLQHWACLPQRSMVPHPVSAALQRCTLPSWRLWLIDALAFWFTIRLQAGLEYRKWEAKFFPA